MAVIGKGELANRLVEKQVVKSTSEANKVLNGLLESIEEALASGDEVRLTGFGTFRVNDTKERTGRNPRTGEAIKIPAGKRASFSASSRLAESFKAGAKS